MNHTQSSSAESIAPAETYKSESVIFGVPLEESDDHNLEFVQTENLPAAEAVAEDLNVFYGDNDFFDAVEIFTGEDCGGQAISTAHLEVAASAIPVTVASEIHICDDESLAKLCAMDDTDHFFFDDLLYLVENDELVCYLDEEIKTKDKDEMYKKQSLLSGHYVSYCCPSVATCVPAVAGMITATSITPITATIEDNDVDDKKKQNRQRAILRWRQKREKQSTPHARHMVLNRQRRKWVDDCSVRATARSRSDSISRAIGKGVKRLAKLTLGCGDSARSSSHYTCVANNVTLPKQDIPEDQHREASKEGASAHLSVASVLSSEPQHCQSMNCIRQNHSDSMMSQHRESNHHSYINNGTTSISYPSLPPLISNMNSQPPYIGDSQYPIQHIQHQPYPQCGSQIPYVSETQLLSPYPELSSRSFVGQSFVPNYYQLPQLTLQQQQSSFLQQQTQTSLQASSSILYPQVPQLSMLPQQQSFLSSHQHQSLLRYSMDIDTVHVSSPPHNCQNNSSIMLYPQLPPNTTLSSTQLYLDRLTPPLQPTQPTSSVQCSTLSVTVPSSSFSASDHSSSTTDNSSVNGTSSVSSSSGQTNSAQTARQQATAKRPREKGRFKKAQLTWVSVTDLFFSSK